MRAQEFQESRRRIQPLAITAMPEPARPDGDVPGFLFEDDLEYRNRLVIAGRAEPPVEPEPEEVELPQAASTREAKRIGSRRFMGGS